MIKIFEFLWHGCWHDWKFIKHATVNHQDGVTYTASVYHCSKCDRIQVRETV